jgi:hypothetical protein
MSLQESPIISTRSLMFIIFSKPHFATTSGKDLRFFLLQTTSIDRKRPTRNDKVNIEGWINYASINKLFHFFCELSLSIDIYISIGSVSGFKRPDFPYHILGFSANYSLPSSKKNSFFQSASIVQCRSHENQFCLAFTGGCNFSKFIWS